MAAHWLKRCLALALALLPVLAWAASWGLRIAEDARGPGALVTAVTPGGSAARAGIQAGDLIIQADGRKVLKAGDLAILMQDWPPDRPLRLGVSRHGWVKDVQLVQTGPAAMARPSQPLPLAPMSAMPATVGSLKATVAVGDFQVKAAKAGSQIGDGLREMLVTALHNSGRFIVLERMDIKGLAAEQALSRSAMARSGMAIPGGGMDVAEVMVYGAVTEFEGDASGSNFRFGLPGVPMTLGGGGKKAHMAVDVRAVDVRTGRILLSRRIIGSAESSQGSLGASPSVGGQSMPVSFGAFRNTPMEKAIRDTVAQATQYLVDRLPPGYFSHQ